jgi:alkylation response protein AidB-like acyl-CoA dehydrogenase
MGEIHDQARAWYEEHWDPELAVRRWWRLLADSGWGMPAWPTRWYGRGLTAEQAGEAERARVAVGAFGPPAGLAVTLVAPTVFTHGPDTLLDRYLDTIVTGEELWCQLFSEPGAGSDLAGLSTRAERDGDQWVVNGQKVWTSGGHLARRAVLMARTDPAAARHRGITFFVVDMDQPGVEVRPLRDMTGDAEFNEVVLTDVRVEGDDVIGAVHDGWRVAMTMLTIERDLDAVGHDGGGDLLHDVDPAAPVRVVMEQQSTGTRSGFGYALGTVKDEVVEGLVRRSGRAGDPVLRQAIAANRIRRRVLEWNAQRGTPASINKVANSELCRRLRDTGFAAGGAHSLLTGADAPDGGHFRKFALFASGMSIAGGTDEVQRNISGERTLGLPKEPDPARDGSTRR